MNCPKCGRCMFIRLNFHGWYYWCLDCCISVYRAVDGCQYPQAEKGGYNMANSEPVILFKRACPVHRKVTWHLLCLSGVLQCLECFLEN